MKRIIMIVTLALLLTPAAALAGTSVTVDMDVQIPQILNIKWAVSGASVQLTGANTVTATEFTQGYKSSIGGGTIMCDANSPFDVTVEASAANFVGGSGTKSTQDLYVDLDGAGTYSYQINGTNAVTILNEQPAASSETHDLQYKLLLAASDIPGIYATDLTYTILVD